MQKTKGMWFEMPYNEIAKVELITGHFLGPLKLAKIEFRKDRQPIVLSAGVWAAGIFSWNYSAEFVGVMVQLLDSLGSTTQSTSPRPSPPPPENTPLNPIAAFIDGFKEGWNATSNP